ncbi:MAG: ABC transporter permease, partial [Spirochaetaceae bacterium]
MQATGTSSRMSLFFRTTLARAYPRLIGLFREKSWFFFGVLLPVLNIAAYVLIYRVMGASKDFEGFAVFGGAMMAFWLNMLWGMSMQLYWDKEFGNLALYIQSPAS